MLPQPRLIGYARVSTTHQNLDVQLEALKKAGCTEIYEEKDSGANDDRPVFFHITQIVLKPGDTLIVYKFDRMSRSLDHLSATVKSLKSRGIFFRSINESFDTSSPMGEFMVNILGSIAQLERDMIHERCNAGIKAALARGVKFGRKVKITQESLDELMFRVRENKEPISKLAPAYGVSRKYVYDQLKKHRPTYGDPITEQVAESTPIREVEPEVSWIKKGNSHYGS